MAEIQSSFKRVEKKFVLTEKEYEILLPVITQHMVSDQYGEYTICNIYYDTDSYELIRKSIEKPVYKEKFRVRSYGVPSDTDMIFAEIKKKYKGVVYKRRVADEYTKVSAFVRNEDPLEQDFQIQNEIKNFMDRYHPVPKVFIAYDRTAFAGREGEDIRVTFDRNIRFRTDHLDLREGEPGRTGIIGEESYHGSESARSYSPLACKRIKQKPCVFGFFFKIRNLLQKFYFTSSI